MKCDINILFVLSLNCIHFTELSHTFEEPVKKKGKMNKGVLTEHLSVISYNFVPCVHKGIEGETYELNM